MQDSVHVYFRFDSKYWPFRAHLTDEKINDGFEICVLVQTLCLPKKKHDYQSGLLKIVKTRRDKIEVNDLF